MALNLDRDGAGHAARTVRAPLPRSRNRHSRRGLFRAEIGASEAAPAAARASRTAPRRSANPAPVSPPARMPSMAIPSSSSPAGPTPPPRPSIARIQPRGAERDPVGKGDRRAIGQKVERANERTLSRRPAPRRTSAATPLRTEPRTGSEAVGVRGQDDVKLASALEQSFSGEQLGTGRQRPEAEADGLIQRAGIDSSGRRRRLVRRVMDRARRTQDVEPGRSAQARHESR